MGKAILTIVGNLGQNAECRTTKDGKTIAVFSVPFSNYSTKKVQWVKVEYWNPVDTVFNCLTKGRQVFVVGQLQPEEYTNQQGVVVQQLKLTANHLELGSEPRAKQAHTGGEPFPQSDLPF